MEELKKLKKFLPFLVPMLFIMGIVCLVMIVSSSSSGDSSVMAGVIFRVPFKDEVHYTVTSNFGNRSDPFGTGEIKHHSGMDLSAPAGTEIIAVGDGVVYETGYAESGLGNYVYIKHNIDGLIYYTVYGHMLDNSIKVIKDQEVFEGDVIGTIGSTGLSTGTHLHFTITTPILSFSKEYLVDPYYVINGL